MTRRKLAGYQSVAMIIRKASPPNVLIGGPVPVLPGFPIEAFGNDGLSEVWEQRVTQQAVENQTAEMKAQIRSSKQIQVTKTIKSGF